MNPLNKKLREDLDGINPLPLPPTYSSSSSSRTVVLPHDRTEEALVYVFMYAALPTKLQIRSPLETAMMIQKSSILPVNVQDMKYKLNAWVCTTHVLLERVIKVCKRTKKTPGFRSKVRYAFPDIDAQKDRFLFHHDQSQKNAGLCPSFPRQAQTQNIYTVGRRSFTS